MLSFPNSWLGREDKGLKMRLLKPVNLAGVLAWGVEGARRWYARPNGLEAPTCVMGATEKARADLDYVAHWLEECVEPTRDEAGFVPNSELYTNYTHWCEENGVTPLPKGKLTAAPKAKSLDAGTSKRWGGRVQRGCAGVRLLANDVDS